MFANYSGNNADGKIMTCVKLFSKTLLTLKLVIREYTQITSNRQKPVSSQTQAITQNGVLHIIGSIFLSSLFSRH